MDGDGVDTDGPEPLPRSTRTRKAFHDAPCGRVPAGNRSISMSSGRNESRIQACTTSRHAENPVHMVTNEAHCNKSLPTPLQSIAPSVLRPIRIETPQAQKAVRTLMTDGCPDRSCNIPVCRWHPSPECLGRDKGEYRPNPRDANSVPKHHIDSRA